MERLPLDPVWKQAALDAAETFGYGEIIPLDWLDEHLQLAPSAGRLSAEDHAKLSFLRLQRVTRFTDAMLCEHQRYLRNVRGVGYLVVRPENQTAVAMAAMRREISGALVSTMRALVHVNERLLTLEDARLNADAKAKVAYLKSFMPKALETDANQH